LLRGDGITYDPEEPNKNLMIHKLTVVNDKLFYSTRVNTAIYLYQEDGTDRLIDEAVINQIVYYLTNNQTYKSFAL